MHPADAEGMAGGIERLLNDDSLRHGMGENAARDARKRFDLQRQVDDYLEWYAELLDDAVPQYVTTAVMSQPSEMGILQ